MKTAVSGAIPENKRGDQRLITVLPIGLKLTHKSHEDVGVFQLINISSSGASAIVSHSLQIGEHVSARLKLPTDGGLTIKCKGQVRRCEPLRSHEDHLKQYLCGLSLETEPEEKKALEKFISTVVNEGSGVFDRRNPSRIKNGLVFSNPEKFSTFRLSQSSAHIQIRQLSMADLDELEAVEIEAWGKEMCATRSMLKSRLTVFPEGMIGARKDGKLLGYVGLMKVNSSLCDKNFTWMGITDGGHIRATHDEDGDCLYGVSLSVVPGAPKNIAIKLLKAAGKLSVRKQLKGILFGCRIPNYHKHSSRMSVEEYIAATSSKGRILDPELSLYRQVNCRPVRPIPDYFEDPESLNYGVLVFFENPFYGIQTGEFPFFFEKISVDFT